MTTWVYPLIALNWSERRPAPSIISASSLPLEESLSGRERDWTSLLLHCNG